MQAPPASRLGQRSGPALVPHAVDSTSRISCHAGTLTYTALVVISMLAYLAAFSPGMSPVPWAVNAEIYPLQVTFEHLLCMQPSIAVQQQSQQPCLEHHFERGWQTHCSPRAVGYLPSLSTTDCRAATSTPAAGASPVRSARGELPACCAALGPQQRRSHGCQLAG